MAELPDEIWTEILDYLDPNDIVSSQAVSSRLLKLARDSTLWRYKCFEKSPSAAYSQASRSNALSALTGALGGLSLGGELVPTTPSDQSGNTTTKTSISKRAKAVAEWDHSDQSEKINWYSEYVARNAPLSAQWAQPVATEIRGMSVYGQQEKVICPLEDGSICIWDLQSTSNGRHKLNKLATSKSGILFQDLSSIGQSSALTRVRSLGHAVDNISTDSKRGRAFAAAGEYLSEVDLETLQVVSQSKFAWPITALSQERINQDYNLTIGTSWSLHLHDPRVPLGGIATVSDETSQVDVAAGDNNIAFLPNYSKGFDRYPRTTAMRTMTIQSSSPPTTTTTTTSPLLSALLPITANDQTSSPASSSPPSWRLNAFARVEPGPQSILHHNANSIIIAGRMPSILFYDRRFFPRLESVIHSGARLSAMTTLPFPPSESATLHTTPSSNSRSSTLLACGEYNGCGSLEIYELPDPISASSPPSSSTEPLYKVRNRQEASSSKLLSLAVQGTRIVFSDADGNLKWVERDGRGLARRWNINAYRFSTLSTRSTNGAPGGIMYAGAEVSGEQVVRKMVALNPVCSSSTNKGTHDGIAKGDGDLLVWTGEKIGVVTTKPVHNDSNDENGNEDDELARAFNTKMRLSDDGHENEDQEKMYNRVMRQALERQADERRWMSRFGGRRW